MEAEPEEHLSEEDKAVFIGALKNGFGLTVSARFILWSAKDISHYIKTHSAFHKECEKAIKFSAKALLVMSNTYLEHKKFEKWRSNNSFIQDFRLELVFWEDYCERRRLKDSDIIPCWSIYKNLDDTATALGLTLPELKSRIIKNKKLFVYFKEENII